VSLFNSRILRSTTFLSALALACYGQNISSVHVFDTEIHPHNVQGDVDDTFPRDIGGAFSTRSSMPATADGTTHSDDFDISVEDHPRPSPNGIAGTISAENLAKPPSKAAIKILNKAQRYSEAGDSAKAIEVLRNAPKDPAGAPYLHSRLGTEYLKIGQYALAMPELEEAARLLPKEPAHHSNLAYGYQMLGQLDRAEKEARLAVELDHSNAKAHFLLGSILLNQEVTLQEAMVNLKLARQEVPSARFLLSQAYLFTGQRDAAEREIQDFLSVATDAQREAARRWMIAHTSQTTNRP
jgi:predicted Zn-dependent protease